MIQLAIFVTDFADAGVVIPLCVVVAATLLLLGRPRVAAIWAAVSLSVWGTMVALKIAGYATAYLIPDLREQMGLVTASGHTADAAATYGALAGLLAGPAKTAVRRAWLTALAVALLIGITRIVLREHTLSEAVVGGAVGVAGAAAFAGLAGQTLQGSGRAAVLAATIGTLILLHGDHFSLENKIAAASARVVRTLDLL